MRLLLINGPNLNLLGRREPDLYGSLSLAEIEKDLVKKAVKLEVELECFQSNSEGEIIDRIHKSLKEVDGIMINAGAFTHTSVALRDALLAVNIPFVELHLSNIYSREQFREKSFLADRALGIVCGFGPMSYQLALDGMVDYLSNLENSYE